MSDYVPPCADPNNNPDDWFIEKDGRQYADEDLVTEADLEELGGLPTDATAEERDAVMEALEDQARKAALVRRRHARDKCHVECYARLRCLGVALGDEGPTGKPDVDYGIRGGYYPEELRQIVRVREQRDSVD